MGCILDRLQKILITLGEAPVVQFKHPDKALLRPEIATVCIPYLCAAVTPGSTTVLAKLKGRGKIARDLWPTGFIAWAIAKVSPGGEAGPKSVG